MSKETNTETPADRTPPANGSRDRRNSKLVKGFAYGIGSAAIVAALLYANRPKGKEPGESS